MNKMNITQKRDKLKTILEGMESVLVAYSGGVDSTLLLKTAGDVLGGNKVLAVIAKSRTYPSDETEKAGKLAEKLKIRHKIITTNELSDPQFSSNPVNRCYYCKKELFLKMKRIVRENNLKFIADGSNYDDIRDFRPGSRAKCELGVRSPLQEAGLTKEDIRALSKKLKLPTWNKPSLACLASRFPYGKHLTAKELNRVEKAEKFLQESGFRQVRVRHYGDTARIEVEKEEIRPMVDNRRSIVKKLKKLGYIYVTLDLEGYRSGSMNETLKKQ
jgi:pyridinium-3,5-biscarboxylic acid mononucleotide sulfurtransferase